MLMELGIDPSRVPRSTLLNKHKRRLMLAPLLRESGERGRGITQQWDLEAAQVASQASPNNHQQAHQGQPGHVNNAQDHEAGSYESTGLSWQDEQLLASLSAEHSAAGS